MSDIIKPNYKPVTPFKGWVIEDFPFIEADFDAVTNYEMLSKITEYLNKLMYNSNITDNKIIELVDAFNSLKTYVDEYLISIPDFKKDIEDLNSAIADLVIQIANLDTKIDTEVEELADLINDNYTLLKNYVDYQVSVINNRIDNLEIGAISIYDPTTGLLSPLQTVINNLAQASNKDGLTATEFDALDLTATAFDSYDITAYEFDSAGKIILV